jgi:hypothetical protein
MGDLEAAHEQLTVILSVKIHYEPMPDLGTIIKPQTFLSNQQ